MALSVSHQVKTCRASMVAEPEDAIRLIVSFFNTVDIEAGTDVLRTTGGILRWLVSRGLAAPTDSVGVEDQAELVELRDALRGLLAAGSAMGVGQGYLETANRTAGRIPLIVSVDANGTMRLESRESSASARTISAILLAVLQAQGDGSWSRIKVCRNPGCQWVFYDRSKNQIRRWCDMRVCGNRAKARNFRERRRSAGEAEVTEGPPGQS